MEQPCDLILQKRIDRAKQATESFVCLCTIATGILSFIAFTHKREIWNRYPGWIRTLRSTTPTIATVKAVLVQDFPVFMELFPNVPLCSIVRRKQRDAEFFYRNVA